MRPRGAALSLFTDRPLSHRAALMDAVAAMPSSPASPLPFLLQPSNAPLTLDLASLTPTEEDDDDFELLAPFVPGAHRGAVEVDVDDELEAEDALVRSLLEPEAPFALSPRRPLTPQHARSLAEPAAPAPTSDPFGFRHAPKHLARPRDRTPEAPVVAPPLSPASSASYISYVVTPPRRPPSPVPAPPPPTPPPRHEPSTLKKSVVKVKQAPCTTADLVDELPRRRPRAVKSGAMSDHSDGDDDERCAAASVVRSRSAQTATQDCAQGETQPQARAERIAGTGRG